MMTDNANKQHDGKSINRDVIGYNVMHKIPRP